MLITKPVQVTAGVLQLNADASRGMVRVGVAASDPVPTFDGTTPSFAAHLLVRHMLPGLTFDDCEPIYADSVGYAARFKNGESLDSLRGRSVCLLFEMVDADLYAFRLG